MPLAMRPYRPAEDFVPVGRFLVETYEPGSTLVNWLQPRWEYMHAHSNIGSIAVGAIGVATDGGEIVGVVHPEHTMAFVYFQAVPGAREVRAALIDWAEARLGGWSRTYDRHLLGCYIDDHDVELQELAGGRGFAATDEHAEDHARVALTAQVPEPRIPTGYALHSLAESNDLSEVHRVLWRGFDHDGPVPESGIAARQVMQETPGFRKDLNVVAVAADGHYAAYAGMWLVSDNHVGYVEPVATDPDHRRRGVGRAAVLETLRRVRDQGADVAWVGSGQAFYTAMGFRITCRTRLWLKG